MLSLLTIRIMRLFAYGAVGLALLFLSGCSGGGGDGGGGGTSGEPVSSLALFAGDMGGAGNVDGTGAAARFDFPTGIAADSAGNVYVADFANSTIRKITPAGVVTTFAGTAGNRGYADGTGAAAVFFSPAGVAIDSADNIYVTDTTKHVIRKITPAGVVTTLAGNAGSAGNTDDTGPAARFNQPYGIAVDATDNVYVADRNNHTIRKITPAGVVTTIAGSAGNPGNADGAAITTARFNNPLGVALDSAGNVYVADDENQTIRKISGGTVTTFAGAAGSPGSADGTGAAARFSFPNGVATDSADNVYVGDAGNYTIRKITPAGAVTTLAGSAGNFGDADGTGAGASFFNPTGVATDSAGNIFVADGSSSKIRKVTPAGVVTTLAGPTLAFGSADGTGAEARFSAPQGVAADSAGNVYVADSSSTIRKITPAGVVSTLAGTPGVSGSADGTGAAAEFAGLRGIATDGAGNVYVADSAHTIRKITPAGVVTTLAGTAGVFGSADGTGPTASFGAPSGVATDSAGNIYVADTNNHTIRMITPAGVVTTFAGTAGSSGSADGTGTAARFFSPSGVATDGSDNVYVADNFNLSVRKITPAGVVTTLAGSAGNFGHVDGTGSAASFRGLFSIAADSTGNVYVSEPDHTIRKVTPAGVATTVVGVAGQSSFLPGTLPGLLRSPSSVAVSGTSLYITLYNGVAVVRNRP